MLEQKEMLKGLSLQKAHVIWPVGGEGTVRQPMPSGCVLLNSGSKP